MKATIAENEKEFLDASKKLLMVNIMEESDEGHNEEVFTKKGGYIPRVFFLDPATGLPSETVVSENAQYPNFFHSRDVLVKAMKKAGETLVKTEL